jgi:hypothetical protein
MRESQALIRHPRGLCRGSIFPLYLSTLLLLYGQASALFPCCAKRGFVRIFRASTHIHLCLREWLLSMIFRKMIGLNL